MGSPRSSARSSSKPDSPKSSARSSTSGCAAEGDAEPEFKEFDSLYRLGTYRFQPGEIQVLLREGRVHPGGWYSIISGYASPEGGRLWVVPTFMAVRPHINLGVFDPQIDRFRGPAHLELATDEELEEWGVHSTGRHGKVVAAPPALDGVVTATCVRRTLDPRMTPGVNPRDPGYAQWLARGEPPVGASGEAGEAGETPLVEERVFFQVEEEVQVGEEVPE